MGIPSEAASSRLDVSTAIDLTGQDKTRSLLEEEIAKITLSLNNLQAEDPRGYNNRGRVKLRERLGGLTARLSALPAPVPKVGVAPDAALNSLPRLTAPVFAGARIDSDRIGVAQLKYLPLGQ